MKRYWAAVPGTLGELVQGTMGGRFFHVTCPINREVEVSVTLTPETGLRGFGRKPKARRLVEGFLAEGYRLPGRLHFTARSPLPPGKGLASSTAELAALGALLYRIWQIPFDPVDLGRRLARVEPTDGVFRHGVVSFDHRQGECLEEWGPPPPIPILPLDWGGKVSTVAFNRRKDLHLANRSKEKAVGRALDLLQKGFRQGSLDKIGLAATESILANQPLLPKTGLEKLAEKVFRWGGLGICGAHSGTVVGILLPHGHSREEWRERLVKEFPNEAPRWLGLFDGGLSDLQLSSGGIRWEEQAG